MPSNNDGFGRNIRALREDHKLTQGQLANALDMSTPAVSYWETKGSAPHKKEAIEKMCDLFGVTRRDLFGYSDGYYAQTRGGADAEPVATSATLPVDGEGAKIACPPEYCKEGNYYVRMPDNALCNVIAKGSYVLVDVSLEPKDGDIVLAQVGNEPPILRRYSHIEGLTLLSPDSPDEAYERTVIDTTRASAPDVRVIGCAVYAATMIGEGASDA